MHVTRRTALSVAGSMLIASAAIAQDSVFDPSDEFNATNATRAAFREAHPESGLLEHHGRITRVYGKSFSSGAGPIQSAEAFRLQYAPMLGVPADDLLAFGAMPTGDHLIPVLYDPATDSYRFSLVSYTQHRGGVPVFGGEMRVLVRNEPGFPAVLAATDIRPIGDFQAGLADVDALNKGALDSAAAARIAPGATVLRSRAVIFAGAGEELEAPRLAWEAMVVNGVDEWLLVIDAASGEELYREFLICFQDLSGSVEGLVTSGIGAEQCEPELPVPLPYLVVTADGVPAVTDIDGTFVFTGLESLPKFVQVTLDGHWFDVFHAEGEELVVTVPGDELQSVNSLLLNAANNDPLVRAQVNAYEGANRVRDYVLSFNPAYPALDATDFEVNVNRTDGYCPGNAWYSPGEQSINFCQAGPNNPNTAWSSVIFHEYGHHLVWAAGSGQGAYGEGMGDCISVLLLDSPALGLGFHNNCNASLRNADNNCQYQSPGCSTCGSASHSCGNLISGCIWDLRQNLAASDPEGYRETLSALTINSILLHTGSSINSAITVDFLTLDDDNDNILDGTPHYTEINTAFADHGMPGPMLQPLKFTFPNGLPTQLTPAGGEMVAVIVSPLTAQPEPGSGTFHYRVNNGPFTAELMSQQGANNYLASFPQVDCGSEVRFYFSAEDEFGQVTTSPSGAPTETYVAFVTTDGFVVHFEDNFENDLGWTVTNSAGLTDGAWDRGVPVANCDRGNPPTDADGSGQCYLTDNSAAGNCNSDVDNGVTRLTSPALDATVPNAYISYWRWYSNVEGDSPYQDVFTVQVSDNNGATWTNLEVVGPTGPEVEGGWYFKQFRIDAFVEPTSTFRIRFLAEDANPGSVVEAAVDGVRIQSLTCDPGLFGDLNGDGFVNGADLGVLLGNWGGSGAGDLNNDGTVDGADVGMLLAAWTS